MSVNQNTDVVTTKLQEIYMTCCAEKRQFFFGVGGWLFAVGESWDGEEEGEIREERVGRVGIY
jgi:hypothetical protein